MRGSRKLLASLAASSILAAAAACVGTLTEGESLIPGEIATVELTPLSLTLVVGAKAPFSIALKDAQGELLDPDEFTVEWSTSNPAVATVVKTSYARAEATAAAPGTATVTVSVGEKTVTALVTVTSVPVSSVAVTPGSTSVDVAKTVQLSATARDASGTTLPNRPITWSSSSTQTAVVSASGVVTGVAAGTATITATSEGKSGTSTVTVNAVIAPVASVTVSPASASVQQGSTTPLTATLKDANGSTLTGRTVAWTTSASSVATVSSSGVVTGVAAGQATLTATSEGKSGTASVTVTASAVAVATVSVVPSPATVQIGSTSQLTAVTKDAAGNVLSGRAVAWTSSETGFATVSSSGLVSGIALGTSTITATSEGRSGSATLTVIPVPTGSVTFVGAGDIADCGNSTDELTADLLDNISGAVFTLGDNVYDDGSASEFANCYAPSWGRHKARTYPTAGNHDYHQTGAGPYFDYFNGVGNATGPAGERGKGYYSYDLGAWHIIALNSNIAVSASSAQVTWLKADLAASTKQCTIAYWHHPRFSSGKHGNASGMQPIWQVLYDAGAEIVLSGHDHTYERFAPQTPTGVADPVRGIREFVIGTGGAGLYAFGTIAANSEVRNNKSYGVMKFTLSAGSYTWEFVPAPGSTFTDSGSGTCR